MRVTRWWRQGLLVAATVLLGTAMQAQAPPTGSTGQCNDGSYTTAAKKWQACGGHKGVKSWFADANGAKPAAGTAAAGATSAATAKATAGGTGTAAPGGGPGQVWVNLDSKVYHCPGGTFYGKTKNGKYMSEADAKAMGAKPDRGKACGK